MTVVTKIVLKINLLQDTNVSLVLLVLYAMYMNICLIKGAITYSEVLNFVKRFYLAKLSEFEGCFMGVLYESTQSCNSCLWVT